MSLFNRRASHTTPLPRRIATPAPTSRPIVTPPLVSSPLYPHTGRLEPVTSATLPPVPGSLESVIQQARYWQGEAIRNGNRAMELAAVINHAQTVRLVARRFLSSYADLKRVAKAIEQMRPDTSLPLHITAGDLLELIRALDLENEVK